MAEEVPVDILRSWIGIRVDVIVHVEKISAGTGWYQGSPGRKQARRGLTHFHVYRRGHGLRLDFPSVCRETAKGAAIPGGGFKVSSWSQSAGIAAAPAWT